MDKRSDRDLNQYWDNGGNPMLYSQKVLQTYLLGILFASAVTTMISWLHFVMLSFSI